MSRNSHPVLHHVTLKTNRQHEMEEWYGNVVGMKPNHSGPFGAWLTNDAANHRLRTLCHLVLTLPEFQLD